MKTIFAVLAFCLPMLFSGNALADAKGPGGDAFYELIITYRQSCEQDCRAPFKGEAVFDASQTEHSPLPVATQEHLKAVAFNQAQIWGDTILEGDYVSAGETQLDRVLVLYKNDEVIGYKITYSEQAWFTGECEYDANDESTLNKCTPGRIRESSFVSPDFRTYFRDEDHFADFE